MISIRVLGLDEGIHPVEIQVKVEDIEGISEEFFGNLDIEGEMKFFNGRHSLDINIACNARLICDRSAEEFIEDIDTDIKLLFDVGGDSVKFLDDDTYDPESIVLSGNSIDITKVVVDELSLALPMKRISPKYRDKDFEELYPDRVEKTESTNNDSPWNELNKLKFN